MHIIHVEDEVEITWYTVKCQSRVKSLSSIIPFNIISLLVPVIHLHFTFKASTFLQLVDLNLNV